MLELVSRLRQRLREQVVRVPRHPAEELGGHGDRANLGRHLRLTALALRREPGQNVGDRGRREERPDEMPAATLVLFRRALPLLVGADRDVLRAVVRRELARTQREDGRRDRGNRRQELPCDWPQSRFAHAADERRRA